MLLYIVQVHRLSGLLVFLLVLLMIIRLYRRPISRRPHYCRLIAALMGAFAVVTLVAAVLQVLDPRELLLFGWMAIFCSGIAVYFWLAARKARLLLSPHDPLIYFVEDPRHCGRCGYDLIGNTSGACPECGWGIPFEGAEPKDKVP